MKSAEANSILHHHRNIKKGEIASSFACLWAWAHKLGMKIKKGYFRKIWS